MTATDQGTNPDFQPLTISHGRKLYDKSEEIWQGLSRLTPLLALLERPEPIDGEDPIGNILRLLEALAAISQHQTATLLEIDSKLEALLEKLNAETR
jgi:hypothetical protein